MHEFQFINLPKELEYNYEFCPISHFYQNLAEAEYIVSVYMYMCLQGYDPSKITILTTYNGQKALIKDIIKQKCAWNPIFKNPKKVTTVDRYQGQQNDYVLLSLVRTKYPGHIRDIRRLIVALSRGKLGLYVFGCWNLFANCQELKSTFDIFAKKPMELCLMINENMWGMPQNLRIFKEDYYKDSLQNPKQISNSNQQVMLKIQDHKHMYRVVNELMKIRSAFFQQKQIQQQTPNQ
jgi:intron-binding protein aquarius